MEQFLQLSERFLVVNILKSIDYEKLARHNTSVPGFGKADVINEYIKTTNREPQDEGLFA